MWQSFTILARDAVVADLVAPPIAVHELMHVLKSGFVISFPFNVLPDSLKYGQPL